MRTTPGHARPLLLLGAFLVAVTACDPAPSASRSPSTVPRAAPDATATRVTEADYRAAFTTYATCMAEGGFPVKVVDDDGPVVRYGVPEGATASGVDEACYAAFRPADRAWQARHETPAARAARLRACLEHYGVAPSGTVRGDRALAAANGLTAVCP
ncbi:hypothetical protein ACFWNK_36430 [Streptomyces sp. NPDC058417]|uniref:hypothetical protein n=2 Tax=Streptomyces TaxID=1883 RepID=UPI0036523870